MLIRNASNTFIVEQRSSFSFLKWNLFFTTKNGNFELITDCSFSHFLKHLHNQHLPTSYNITIIDMNNDYLMNGQSFAKIQSSKNENSGPQSKYRNQLHQHHQHLLTSYNIRSISKNDDYLMNGQSFAKIRSSRNENSGLQKENMF